MLLFIEGIVEKWREDMENDQEINGAGAVDYLVELHQKAATLAGDATGSCEEAHRREQRKGEKA